MKINFTKQHMERLIDLADAALFDRTIITTKLGQPLNIYELLHTTSINQLNEIKIGLSKKIEKAEQADEWVQSDNEKIQAMKDTKELVNLIIGWKRYNLELDENARKKEELHFKLTELKELTILFYYCMKKASGSGADINNRIVGCAESSTRPR